MGALHGVGADGQSDVDPIVHDQLGAVLARRAPDLAAERRQVSGAEVLLANLNGRQPGRQAFPHHRDQISPARLRAVGDQAETQLVQSGRPSSGEDAVA